MTTKSKGESVRQKLNTLSTKLGVKYANLETIFLIERLVARLTSGKVLSQQKKETPMLLSTDEELSWSVYPVETIIAEKLHALISHGDQNSRSKDVHDLAIFLPKADASTLREAIKKCFEYRKTKIPINFSNALKELDTTRLEKGWACAVASVPSTPSFQSAFDTLFICMTKMEEDFG